MRVGRSHGVVLGCCHKKLAVGKAGYFGRWKYVHAYTKPQKLVVAKK